MSRLAEERLSVVQLPALHHQPLAHSAKVRVARLGALLGRGLHRLTRRMARGDRIAQPQSRVGRHSRLRGEIEPLGDERRMLCGGVLAPSEDYDKCKK